VSFGKVQPGATVWTDDELFIGYGEENRREVRFTGQVFDDNFDPVPLELEISFEPIVRPMTLEGL